MISFHYTIILLAGIYTYMMLCNYDLCRDKFISL